MMPDLLHHPLWQNLGLALLHFLWQGAAITALTVILIHLLRLRHGTSRHFAYLSAMIAMAAAPLVTFCVISSSITAPLITEAEPEVEQAAPAPASEPSNAAFSQNASAEDSSAAEGTAPPRGARSHDAASDDPGALATPFPAALAEPAPAAPTPAATIPATFDSVRGFLRRVAPYAVAVWLLGVAFFGTRLLTGVLVLWKLRRSALPLATSLAGRLPDLALRLRLANFDRVFMSRSLRQPIAMGLLRPMVLVPAAMVTNLPPATIEAIIAHELAHIRRRDPWIILLQRLVETLLFFHPLVWYCSRQLSVQRELCCDSIAANAIGERSAYAEALEQAAQHDLDQRGIALAAALGRRRGALLQRVQHLLGVSSPSSRTAWPAGLLALLVLALGISFTLPTPPAVGDDGADRQATLVVRLMDEETGKPIPDARVTLAPGPLESMEASTDEEGAHIFKIPPVSLHYVALRVEAPGHIPLRKTWRREGATLELPPQYTFTMKRGSIVGGTFINERGEPLEGMRAWIWQWKGTDAVPEAYLDHVEFVSDEHGRWSCDLMPPDAEQLSLGWFHPDYASSVGTGMTTYRADSTPSIQQFYDQSAVVVLKEGTTIEGVVRDEEGDPVSGADVGLRLVERSHFPTVEMTETDSDGRFRFTVEPDPIVLMIQAQGYQPWQQVVNAATDQTLDVQLEPGLVIRGRVVDENGNPLRGAVIYRGVSEEPSLFWPTRTDERGRFVWDMAQPGIASMSVSYPGYFWVRDVPMAPSEKEQTIQLMPELIVRGRVFDKATGEPLTQFNVREGMRFDSEETHFGLPERTFTDGQFGWVVSDPGPEPHGNFVFRVQAEGYPPMLSRPVKPEEREVVLEFPLEREIGPAGTVLTRADAAARGAQVILSRQPYTRVFGLAFHDEGHDVVFTDEEGHFEHEPQSEPYVLAVIHDDGSAVRTEEQLPAGEPIVLEPWARVEGIFLVGDQPAAHERVKLLMYDHSLSLRDHAPRLSFDTAITTDDQGRFTFDKVRPGLGKVLHYEVQPSGSIPSASATFDAAAGETAHVQLGGTGRRVVGRIALPAMAPDHLLIDNARSRLDVDLLPFPYPHNWETLSADEKRIWLHEFPRSEAGLSYYQKQFRRRMTLAATIEPDGSFDVEDVPPGEYVLEVELLDPATNSITSRSAVGVLKHRFQVPQAQGVQEEPLDLGTLELQVFTELRAGETAPPLECRTLSGETVRLRDYAGKYVLLDFTATWCGPCVEETPHLKKVYDDFENDDRFVMIGLSHDHQIEALRAYLTKNDIQWPHCFLDEDARRNIIDSYGIRGIPQIMLIGPDGRVLAKDLRGDAIISAVESALNAHHSPPD